MHSFDDLPLGQGHFFAYTILAIADVHQIAQRSANVFGQLCRRIGQSGQLRLGFSVYSF